MSQTSPRTQGQLYNPWGRGHGNPSRTESGRVARTYRSTGDEDLVSEANVACWIVALNRHAGLSRWSVARLHFTRVTDFSFVNVCLPVSWLIDGWMDGCTDGRTGGWMDGQWMDGSDWLILVYCRRALESRLADLEQEHQTKIKTATWGSGKHRRLLKPKLDVSTFNEIIVSEQLESRQGFLVQRRDIIRWNIRSLPRKRTSCTEYSCREL